MNKLTFQLANHLTTVVHLFEMETGNSHVFNICWSTEDMRSRVGRFVCTTWIQKVKINNLTYRTNRLISINKLMTT